MRINTQALLLVALCSAPSEATPRQNNNSTGIIPLYSKSNETRPSSTPLEIVIAKSSSAPSYSIEPFSTVKPANLSMSTPLSKPTTFDTLVSSSPTNKGGPPRLSVPTLAANQTGNSNGTHGRPSFNILKPTGPSTAPKESPLCMYNGTACATPPSFPPDMPVSDTPPTKTRPHGHPPHNTTTPPCIQPVSGTVIEYSIIYPSTVTFTGNRSDYTPPYEPIHIPTYCAANNVESGGATYSAFGADATTYHSDNSLVVVYSTNGQTKTTTLPAKTPNAVPSPAFLTSQTLITSEKNPAVVYTTDPPADYSQPWDKVSSPLGGTRPTGKPNGSGNNPSDPDGAVQPSYYTITAGATAVTINHETFTAGPGETTTVIVEHGTFTINPSSVIGAGETVRRPVPVPVRTTLGGLPVTESGGNVIIDGQTLTKPPAPSSTIVDGKAVVINPSGVVVGDQSLDFAKPTAMVVTGGEVLTAIGSNILVLHSTTITYGPGSPEQITVINGDTVSVEPTGIVVHGHTLGGPSAKATDTRYEIVGGATIGKIPPSMVVINGATYAVGPGTGESTISAGNEMITLGPAGVVMASMTLSVPFDDPVVTTISSTGKPSSTLTNEENGAGSTQPNPCSHMICICIAIGVLVLM